MVKFPPRSIYLFSIPGEIVGMMMLVFVKLGNKPWSTETFLLKPSVLYFKRKQQFKQEHELL